MRPRRPRLRRSSSRLALHIHSCDPADRVRVVADGQRGIANSRQSAAMDTVPELDEASMGAEEATKFTAILAWVQSQEAVRQARGPGAGDRWRLGIRGQYLHATARRSSSGEPELRALLAVADHIDLKSFRRVRIILRAITLVRARGSACRRHGPGPAPRQLRDRGGVGGSRELDDDPRRLVAEVQRLDQPRRVPLPGPPRRRASASCSSRCRARRAAARASSTSSRTSCSSWWASWRLFPARHGFIDRMPPVAREMGVGFETGFIYLLLHIPNRYSARG